MRSQAEERDKQEADEVAHGGRAPQEDDKGLVFPSAVKFGTEKVRQARQRDVPTRERGSAHRASLQSNRWPDLQGASLRSRCLDRSNPSRTKDAARSTESDAAKAE